MAQTTFAHLGVFSDMPRAARTSHPVAPHAKPGKATQEAVLRALAFNPKQSQPRQVRVEQQWTRDGIEGQRLTWSVGFGPRTEAWYLRPAGVRGRLPGIVALHDHGGFKFLGKEKIATGPGKPTAVQAGWFDRLYGGRPFADELARRGYAVLVPDCFTWGSRRVPLETMPEWDRTVGDAMHAKTPMEYNPPHLMPPAMSRYCWSAVFNENTVQKYCHVMGTSMAGVIAYEDRIAASYLAGRRDVLPGGVACLGLSGGGLRSTLLQATSDRIRAAVVVGLMSTYDDLLDHNVVSHTWMLYPAAELTRSMDWTDLAACRAPSPLMVQYDNEDALFTLKGMRAAHRRLITRYRDAGAADHYVGRFYPGPHKFDVAMQDDAFAWIADRMPAS